MDTPAIRYFAYGSNMLTTRLQRRCPSARVVTTAAAPGYRVAFEKLSEDTSGKATLVRDDTTEPAAGVVYELSGRDRDLLDAIEGAGYRRIDEFPVTALDSGEAMLACTYVAKENVADLRPFDWYLALVLGGLLVHGVGPRQRHELLNVAYEADVRRSRQSRRNALRDLAAAGLADYEALLRPVG